MLIFRNQKRLLDFRAGQLQTIASAIDDDKGALVVENLSEPELHDLIVNCIRGEKLKAMKDDGMTRLLLLDDMIGEILKAQDTRTSEVSQVTPSLRGGEFHTHPASMDRDIHTPTGYSTMPMPAKSSLNGTGSVSRDSINPSASSMDQVVRWNDVSALLPRREFKLHGGQISDAGSDISYVSLGKQIDEGLQQGFSESEVISTVLKITKPGVFRKMLTHKDYLSVELLNVLLLKS